MDSRILKLEKQLNTAISDELKNTVNNIDCELISECSNVLLKMENPKKYQYGNEFKDSLVFKINRKYNSIKALRITLIAAVLIILIAFSVIAVKNRQTVIEYYNNYVSVIFDSDGVKKVRELSAEYIPDGFTVQSRHCEKYDYDVYYTNVSGGFISIGKSGIIGKINISAEKYPDSVKDINGNGIIYTVYQCDENIYGAIWCNNGYQYEISGTLNIKMLLKIAETVK